MTFIVLNSHYSMKFTYKFTLFSAFHSFYISLLSGNLVLEVLVALLVL